MCRSRASSGSAPARPGNRGRIRLAACSPSRSGIEISSTATSGQVSRAIATAWRPFVASPTTCMSGWAFSSRRRPSRTTLWSSASRTRMGLIVVPPSKWQPELHPRTARRRAGHFQAPAQGIGAFLHAQDAQRALPCWSRRPSPRPAGPRRRRRSSSSGRRLSAARRPSRWRALACRITLVIASCAMRKAAVAISGGSAAGSPPASKSVSNAHRRQAVLQLLAQGRDQPVVVQHRRAQVGDQAMRLLDRLADERSGPVQVVGGLRQVVGQACLASLRWRLRPVSSWPSSSCSSRAR